LDRKTVHIQIPATSGNLGPGFDVLGMALNLYNELRVRVLNKASAPPLIMIRGEGASFLPRNSKNIIFSVMQKVFRAAKKKMPQLELICINRIPLTRGLGSSSAAILSGLLAANHLLGDRFSLDQILAWATELEGHPDNVAPALFGGVRASAVFGSRVVSVPWPVPKTSVVVAVPDFELSTKKARAILPKRISMKDAIKNLAAVSVMPVAFQSQKELMGSLFNDCWHEPYRAKLIPGFYSVKKAALRAGAHAVILSGAGPTMLSFVDASKAAPVKRAMHTAFKKAGVGCTVMSLAINLKGARFK
jgi:homoserine kinase